jgi:hypothetical protein
MNPAVATEEDSGVVLHSLALIISEVLGPHSKNPVEFIPSSGEVFHHDADMLQSNDSHTRHSTLPGVRDMN